MTDSDLNSFDSVAGVYDTLAKLVYGKSIRQAQLYYLDQLRESSNILIIGGGTGWILRSLLEVNANATIWYVEASAKMLEMAKRRNLIPGATINFVHATEDSLPETPVFDAVIANFYFDLFDDERLPKILGTISRCLIPGATLLVADFNAPVFWWQRLLVRVMYGFFRVVSGLHTSDLPRWPFFLEQANFRLLKTRTFYRGFIQSSVYDFVPFPVLFS
jgi:ubiquinone/menaquinone biosynthesis C-methylase UbiE